MEVYVYEFFEVGFIVDDEDFGGVILLLVL